MIYLINLFLYSSTAGTNVLPQN